MPDHVNQAAASVIWTFDLSSVEKRFMETGAQEADALATEFRRFARLCSSHPKETLAPSRMVDEFWHVFLVDTTRYREFCRGSFGAFLEHIPDETGKGMAQEFSHTMEYYRQEFGEPDPRLWGAAGTSMGRLA